MMMKILKNTDLMIGNIVEDENNYQVIEPHCLKDEYFKYLQTWSITLNIDWLLAFNFELIDTPDLTFYNLNGVKIFFTEYNKITTFYHINSELIIYFDYVHELQNWYFTNVKQHLSLNVNLEQFYLEQYHKTIKKI